MSYMILDEDDLDLIWNGLNDLQIIFHPVYAPEGQFEYSEIQALKQNNPVIIFVDRNLLSSLF